MRVCRVSRDLERIRDYVRSIATQKAAEIPAHYMRWINHLAELRKLVNVNPGLSAIFTWDELHGLAIFDEVTRELENMRTCPRCKCKTARQIRL